MTVLAAKILGLFGNLPAAGVLIQSESLLHMMVGGDFFDVNNFPLMALLADEEDALHDERPVEVVELAVFGHLPVFVLLHVAGLHLQNWQLVNGEALLVAVAPLVDLVTMLPYFPMTGIGVIPTQ
jgi:hypothetical protein